MRANLNLHLDRISLFFFYRALHSHISAHINLDICPAVSLGKWCARARWITCDASHVVDTAKPGFEKTNYSTQIRFNVFQYILIIISFFEVFMCLTSCHLFLFPNTSPTCIPDFPSATSPWLVPVRGIFSRCHCFCEGYRCCTSNSSVRSGSDGRCFFAHVSPRTDNKFDKTKRSFKRPDSQMHRVSSRSGSTHTCWIHGLSILFILFQVNVN